MNSIRPGRFSRRAAEQMLDGVPGSGRAGRDPLASVLAAAAAPPRDTERAGEDVAVTAFLAEHLVPSYQPRRGQMIKSPLAKLLTIKAGALALAVSAGGVALAASTGAFTPAPHEHGAASASSAGGHAKIAGHAAARAPARSVHVRAAASGHAIPMLPAPLSAADAVKACRSLASEVHASVTHADSSTVQVLTETGVQKALQSTALRQVLINNPRLASLVATAESRDNVADYCGLLLHLAKLPAPGSLAKLPATVLSALPASVVSLIPASALTAVSAADLSRLPADFLSRLSGPVLTSLPASVLAKLPAGTLTALLPKLPGATLAQLPPKTLAGLLTRLPAKSVTGILTKLPAGSLSRILPALPASLRSALPRSLLAGLPSSLLSQLP